jgi:hypothetical protein
MEKIGSIYFKHKNYTSENKNISMTIRQPIENAVTVLIGSLKPIETSKTPVKELRIFKRDKEKQDNWDVLDSSRWREIEQGEGFLYFKRSDDKQVYFKLNRDFTNDIDNLFRRFHKGMANADSPLNFVSDILKVFKEEIDEMKEDKVVLNLDPKTLTNLYNVVYGARIRDMQDNMTYHPSEKKEK